MWIIGFHPGMESVTDELSQSCRRCLCIHHHPSRFNHFNHFHHVWGWNHLQCEWVYSKHKIHFFLFSPIAMNCLLAVGFVFTFHDSDMWCFSLLVKSETEKNKFLLVVVVINADILLVIHCSRVLCIPRLANLQQKQPWWGFLSTSSDTRSFGNV